MPEPLLRPLGANDLDDVDWCLYTAVVWTPERESYPRDMVLAHPDIAMFREDWGAPTDFGVVASIDGARVGVALGRLFPAERHSAGFVDEETPEIAIAVDKAHRGHGIGRLLLDALADAAREHGFPALSLSVDEGNPAVHLYERAGYKTVPSDEDIVMVLPLA